MTRMKIEYIAGAVFALVFGLSIVAPVRSATDLTPEQKLKAQVQQLTEQNLQLQASLAQCQLTAQASENKAKHQILEAELLKALGAKDGDELDWATLTLKKK